MNQITIKITMTPEEKFNQSVWQLLQEIKLKHLALPINANPHGVEIWLQHNSEFSQRKNTIYKLQEWGAIEVLEGEKEEFDFEEETRFILKVLQPKFDKLYTKYQNACDIGSYGNAYQRNIYENFENGKYKDLKFPDFLQVEPNEVLKTSGGGKPLPQNQPSIKPRALELIAKEVSSFGSETSLTSFLINCGVDAELIDHSQAKWRMIYSVLIALASSTKAEDKETLFNLIEEASHPLMHGGDKEKSLEVQDGFSDYLQFDGLCLMNGKIMKTTSKSSKDIQDRQEKRRDKKIKETDALMTILDNELTPTYFRKPSEPVAIKIIEMPELKIRGLESSQKKAKRQTREDVLLLNKVGDLYREPKAKYCYPMSEAEGRHRIVRYFVENKLHQYYPTSEIARTLEKDEASLMKEIGKINASAQAKLKLKGGSILESKRGSGYRINPNYKITLKDN